MTNYLGKTLYKLENLKNYNKWIYDNIKKHIGKKILEVGCGIGNITDFLINDNRHILGIDIKDDFIKYAQNKYKDKKNVIIKKSNILKFKKKK